MKKTKKLRLSKETVLQLTLTELQQGVQGAATWSGCPMISCNSCTPDACCN